MEFLLEESTQEESKNLMIVPKPRLAGKVVIVNGLSGCGKTMLCPIIGAMPRVELMQYSYMLEYVCQLRYLGRMETDAAAAMIGLITDLQLYNVMMGRETNFRPTDLSGVFRNAHHLRYLLRLFLHGDDAVIKRVESERPILLLTTHNLLPISVPLLEALGSRVLLVEVVRHPLYKIIQHIIAMEREAETATNQFFYIMFDYKGFRLPWFAQGWEKLFLQANPAEKAIYAMYHLTKKAEKLGVIGTGDGKDGVVLIPFERYVINPWPYMSKLEELLDTKMDAYTRKMMKRQNVPRKMYAEGIDLTIYRKYGWRPPKKGSSEALEFERRRKFVAERASAEAMEVLDQLCRAYEETYLRA